MKRIILSLVAIATISLSSFGQAPEGFKYQAVVRDAGNLILNNQTVGMRLTIQQGSIGGTTVYTETFATTTNAYGLVNVEIGTGTTVDDFTTIDWATGPYFMETAVDFLGGTTWVVMGTSQLMSVPYALHAKTAESITGAILETDPVFGASIANGITGMDTTNWNNKLDIELDGSPINELQTLSISNDTIYLSNGGFTVLPPQNNNFMSMQGGTVNIGASMGQELLFIPVTFATAFNSTPNIVCTASTQAGAAITDSFNITVREVTTIGFTMIVNRVDGSVWGQNLDASWFAFQ